MKTLLKKPLKYRSFSRGEDESPPPIESIQILLEEDTYIKSVKSRKAGFREGLVGLGRFKSVVMK